MIIKIFISLALAGSIVLSQPSLQASTDTLQDAEGNTLFDLISYGKRTDDLENATAIELVQRAIEDGADINAINHHGQTPLLLACLTKPHADIAIIRQLISTENINLADTNGTTPLIAFCKEGTRSLPYGSAYDPYPTERSFETLQILLDSGADTAIKDSAGFSASTYARARIFVRLKWHEGALQETYPDPLIDPDSFAGSALPPDNPGLFAQITDLASAAYDIVSGMYSALRRE